METALIICVAGVVGAGIGWFLLKRRQRNARRRVFLAFMAQWKAEIESCWQPPDRLANAFNVKVHSFFREADNLRQDFRGGPMQAAFEGAYQAVTAAGNQITAQDERGELVGRANVLSAFDAIIALVERN